jgi:YjbE family integral membrane protein
MSNPMEDLASQALKILQIIWINIILSGDNAVVIALACRGLPATRKRIGMVAGAGVAVGMRIGFTVVVASLLATPFLKIGSLLLFWIAIKLLIEEEEEGAKGKINETDRLWHAIRTIAIADAVMSLDNVLAIAAVAKDSWFLLILRLGISIPLVILGATLIMALIERFPIFVWLGAGLLGWVAGEMLISDPWLVGQLSERIAHPLELPIACLGALFVVGLGYILRRRKRHGAEEVSSTEVRH